MRLAKAQMLLLRLSIALAPVPYLTVISPLVKLLIAFAAVGYNVLKGVRTVVLHPLLVRAKEAEVIYATTEDGLDIGDGDTDVRRLARINVYARVVVRHIL